MSEAEVARRLLVAAHALRSAEDCLRSDTEYLRHELRELLGGIDLLFEKIHLEHALLEATEVLHARPEPQLQDQPVPTGTTRT